MQHHDVPLLQPLLRPRQIEERLAEHHELNPLTDIFAIQGLIDEVEVGKVILRSA